MRFEDIYPRVLKEFNCEIANLPAAVSYRGWVVSKSQNDNRGNMIKTLSLCLYEQVIMQLLLTILVEHACQTHDVM